MRTLWCRCCHGRYDHLGGTLPAQCPACGEAAHWSALEVPKVAYDLSVNDCRFLKSLRIAVGNDHEQDGA